jgi:TRAP-type uncharacterized transport system fused permease subunit
MFSFAAVTQNYFVTKNRWYEGILLVITTFILLRPYYTTSLLGIDEGFRYVVSVAALAIYGSVFLLQNGRKRTGALPA